MYNRGVYEALTEKVRQLRTAFPGRRVLVIRDDFAAIFESCELEKQGVVITATSLDGSSASLAILWHPRDYSLLVEAVEAIAPVVEFPIASRQHALRIPSPSDHLP